MRIVEALAIFMFFFFSWILLHICDVICLWAPTLKPKCHSIWSWPPLQGSECIPDIFTTLYSSPEFMIINDVTRVNQCRYSREYIGNSWPLSSATCLDQLCPTSPIRGPHIPRSVSSSCYHNIYTSLLGNDMIIITNSFIYYTELQCLHNFCA